MVVQSSRQDFKEPGVGGSVGARVRVYLNSVCYIGLAPASSCIFNAARQLSHIEAAPDKSGLVLLDYWVGMKRVTLITAGHHRTPHDTTGHRRTPLFSIISDTF